jgi:CDP-diacylglycerol pyrophosphatase
MQSSFPTFSTLRQQATESPALLNPAMKQFLKAAWLCPESSKIIVSFSNARIANAAKMYAKN